MASNPLVQQGTLNRVRVALVVANNPSLNVTAPYMGKSQIRLSISGPFTDQIGTATGTVQSGEPYQMATVTVSILRTQALANSWWTQALTSGNIGPVTVYSDSSAYPTVSIDNCSIDNIDNAAFDGTDPVTRVVLKGPVYLNSDLWNLI